MTRKPEGTGVARRRQATTNQHEEQRGYLASQHRTIEGQWEGRSLCVPCRGYITRTTWLRVIEIGRGSIAIRSPISWKRCKHFKIHKSLDRKYDLGFWRGLNQEWLCWRSPAAICFGSKRKVNGSDAFAMLEGSQSTKLWVGKQRNTHCLERLPSNAW
jgi:hypothetical protein